jgi:hypothetical protein
LTPAHLQIRSNVYATNLLAEAEPLIRRHVAIFVEFTRRTGHPHPHLKAAFANYAVLPAAMGKSQAEIEAACAELRRPLPGANVVEQTSAPATAGEGDRPKGGGGGGGRAKKQDRRR